MKFYHLVMFFGCLLFLSCSENKICDEDNFEIIGTWQDKSDPSKIIAFLSNGEYVDESEVLMSSICVSGFWSYNEQLGELSLDCNFILGDIFSNFVLEVMDCDLIYVDMEDQIIELVKVN